MEPPQHRSPTKTLHEFFKVYLPQTSSTHLRIPKAFTKFFSETMPRKATLVDHDGNPWDVDLEKISDGFVVKNGWQQFVRDKCLEEADFLVFEYDGESTFHVKIFSKSGCRKEAANGRKVVPIVILDEDSDNQNSRSMQRGLKRKHSPTTLKINEKSHSEATVAKSKRAYEATGNDHEKKAPSLAKCAQLKNPHFVIPFSGWRMTRMQQQEVPRSVLRELNISLKPNSRIGLRDENGKLWPVRITAKARGRLFLGEGWSDFRKAKNIQEGSLCDFQFVIGKANEAEELLVRVRPPSKRL